MRTRQDENKVSPPIFTTNERLYALRRFVGKCPCLDHFEAAKWITTKYIYGVFTEE